MAKMIAFDQEARDAMRRGVGKLAHRTDQPVSKTKGSENRQSDDDQRSQKQRRVEPQALKALAVWRPV